MRERRLLLLAVLLTALAGWIDATGFLRLGGLFVSFMSGNSTKAVVQAMHGDPAGAGRLAAVVADFAVAAFAGELAGLAAGRRRIPVLLTCEAALLILAWRLRAEPVWLAALLVAAMGWQNALLHQVGDLTLGLTYITGALVRLGRSAARAVAGRGGWGEAIVPATLWLALVAGGLGGALTTDGGWGVSLAVPAGAAALLAIVAMSSGMTPE